MMRGYVYPRILFKYPLILQRIREQEKESLIRNGCDLFNEYRKPFSNARWMYPWIEQFWIYTYAHVVSARQASKMIEIIDAAGGGFLQNTLGITLSPISDFGTIFLSMFLISSLYRFYPIRAV